MIREDETIIYVMILPPRLIGVNRKQFMRRERKKQKRREGGEQRKWHDLFVLKKELSLYFLGCVRLIAILIQFAALTNNYYSILCTPNLFFSEEFTLSILLALMVLVNLLFCGLINKAYPVKKDFLILT